MRITNVKISFDGGQHSNGDKDGDKHFLAFCAITFDHCFVTNDLRIIQGTKGPFVAMCSKKMTDRCLRCGLRNSLCAKYCNECGTRLADGRVFIDKLTGKAKYHTDIAYPITQEFREYLEEEVMRHYHKACALPTPLDSSFGEGILPEIKEKV